MKRRLWLVLGGWLALGGSGCAAASGERSPSGVKVSAQQLQQALAKRFPRNYPVAGLVDVKVQVPQLRLLPALNRLGAEVGVEAGGMMLGRNYPGVLDLDFALRYEAVDQTIRAYQLRFNSLSFAGLPPGQSELLNAYGPKLAEQSLREVVLHQLRPEDLAMPNAVGLQPGSITVTAQGLVIGFVAKPF